MRVALRNIKERRKSRPIGSGRIPTSTDDASKGYKVGTRWMYSVTGVVYVATSVTNGAAVWVLE